VFPGCWLLRNLLHALAMQEPHSISDYREVTCLVHKEHDLDTRIFIPGILMVGQLPKYLENCLALSVADMRMTFRSLRSPDRRSRSSVIKKSDKMSRSWISEKKK